VVTGASSGIGLVAARELAAAGANVVLAVRDVTKGERVAATIRGRTEVRELELDDLASVRAFAAGWTGDLDVLVNNAGIMMVPEARTVDGFERHIATNHLGPFALTNLLLPHITDRVVTTSSNIHATGSVDLEDLSWERRPYDAIQAYADSKLANLWFTFELQRRLAQSGSSVRSIAVHPGLTRTSLYDRGTGIRATLIRIARTIVMQDVRRGALPTLYGATEPIPGGSYVGPDGIGHMRGYPELVTASRDARDVALARRLWDLSVQLTGTDFVGPRAGGASSGAASRADTGGD
jgi:NAD(P)-dependent dehydrogenase (short-subunit alcohol dehydrogenase family)